MKFVYGQAQYLSLVSSGVEQGRRFAHVHPAQRCALLLPEVINAELENAGCIKHFLSCLKLFMFMFAIKSEQVLAI